MNRLMRRKLIFDGRNLFEPDFIRDLGYQYVSIGRAVVSAKDKI